MKVLLVNGSPHKAGCTNRALQEAAGTLNQDALDAENVPNLENVFLMIL